MKDRIELGAPARRERLTRPFKQTGVNWSRAQTGFGCEDVIISRASNSAQSRGDHSVDLKYALHETDEIAAALLDRVVWQTTFVNRQNNEESDPVAGSRLQREFLRGRQHVAVSRAFERRLANAAVGQIQPFHQTHTDFFSCV